MRLMVILLSSLLVCRAPAEQPAPEQPNVEQVTIPMPTHSVRIRSTADFLSAEALLAELVYGETPGGRLELIFKAGRYPDIPLRLDSQDAPLDLVVRGEGEVIFDGGSLALFGRDVEVSNLQFTGQRTFYFLELGATGSLRASNIRFDHARVQPQRRGDSARGALVNLEAHGPETRMELSGWTIVDSAVPGATLVYLWNQPHGRVATALLDGWTVGRSDAAQVLKASLLGDLTLKESWVQVPVGGQLLQAHTVTGALKAEGGRFLVDNPQALAGERSFGLTNTHLTLREGGQGAAVDVALAGAGELRTLWPE